MPTTLPPHSAPPSWQRHGDNAPPRFLRGLLDRAGVDVNGSAPWDMQVHDRAAWGRMLRSGVLGFGESYVDGQWDCERLDQLVCRLLGADADRNVAARGRLHWLAQVARHTLTNLQRAGRAFDVARQHYDVGQDVFAAMLDSRAIYSCAYWPRAQDLEQAQWHKLELIAAKLQLSAGDRVLDIGCGWGGLAEHLARQHACQVLGITVSQEQAQAARQRCAGLPVQIDLIDWRQLAERVQQPFDKLVSVGMFEHVGPKNYRAYFSQARRLLKPDGLFLLHTIGIDRTERHTNAWTDRYIFPGGKLPSAVELTRAVEELFLIEDWHNFGADYDRTLLAWHARFEAAWPRLSQGYDERFRRLWRFYLLSSAGFFRSRQGQLWQVVLAPRERSGVYRSVR